MTKLHAGDPAPDVAVHIGDRRVCVRDLARGDNVVLYFYPKDGSSICTLEARAFNELVDEFAALHTTIVGVSMDDRASHTRFATQEGLRFSLATDPEREAVAAFGAANRLVMGIAARRITFLIGRDGRIARVWQMVNPLTHARDVLDAARTLASSATK